VIQGTWDIYLNKDYWATCLSKNPTDASRLTSFFTHIRQLWSCDQSVIFIHKSDRRCWDDLWPLWASCVSIQDVSAGVHTCPDGGFGPMLLHVKPWWSADGRRSRSAFKWRICPSEGSGYRFNIVYVYIWIRCQPGLSFEARDQILKDFSRLLCSEQELWPSESRQIKDFFCNHLFWREPVALFIDLYFIDVCSSAHLYLSPAQ